MATTAEERRWFWVGGSSVAHRFPEADWLRVGPDGRFDRAVCGAGPAVWPAYCGCEDRPCGSEPRRRCRRCIPRGNSAETLDI